MTRRHLRKGVLIVFGVLFIAFGIGAFLGIPGGHDTSHHTIGHNLTHILAGFGILAVALTGRSATRKRFCFAFGTVYLLIGLCGVFTDKDSLRIIPGVVEFHLDDAWVQIATGLLFVALGMLKSTAKVGARRPVLAS
jgi:hypothetical protein